MNDSPLRLPERFARHVSAAGLFPAPGRALLAVSGGGDSLALLELLARTQERWGLDLEVAHVDHGIVEASAAWAARVAAAAEAHGLPCRVARLTLGPQASETVARRERHRALRRLQRAAAADYLVLAHHADDQVETVLFRVLRGSGPAGLAGMLPAGPRGLVRPLLPFTRRELRTWLREAAPTRDPVDDPANADPRHDRVWIRRVLLPAARERFPDVTERLLALADDAGRQRGAMGRLLDELPALGIRRQPGAVEVARPTLQGYDKLLSEAILRALAREVGCVVGPRRAARLLDFVRRAQSGRVLQLGGGWVAETVFDRLRIHRLAPCRPAVLPGGVAWGGVPSGEASWAGWCIAWTAATAGSATRGGWGTWVTPGVGQVRAARPGDRFRPLGGTGGRPVRRLLMEARVPRQVRTGWPVLERGGDILWIPGVCRSAAALPRPGEAALRLDVHRHAAP